METLKRSPIYGLDSRWSWIQVGFCCWAMFAATLNVRASGVLFVGIMDFYNATREEASWPLTVYMAATSTAGTPTMFQRKFTNSLKYLSKTSNY